MKYEIIKIEQEDDGFSVTVELKIDEDAFKDFLDGQLFGKQEESLAATPSTVFHSKLTGKDYNSEKGRNRGETKYKKKQETAEFVPAEPPTKGLTQKEKAAYAREYYHRKKQEAATSAPAEEPEEKLTPYKVIQEVGKMQKKAKRIEDRLNGKTETGQRP